MDPLHDVAGLRILIRGAGDIGTGTPDRSTIPEKTRAIANGVLEGLLGGAPKRGGEE